MTAMADSPLSTMPANVAADHSAAPRDPSLSQEETKPLPGASPATKSLGHKSNRMSTGSNCKTASKSSDHSRKMKSVAPDKKRPPKLAVKYTCPHCEFETPNIVRHFAHKRQHRETTKSSQHLYKCHNCDYSSNIKGGLQRHIKRVHTKERPFTCPVCNFRTIDKPSMAKHIIKMHKEDVGADVEIYIKCMEAGGGSISEQVEPGAGGCFGEENQSVDQEERLDRSDESFSAKEEDESIDREDLGQSGDASVDEREEDSGAEQGKKTDYMEYNFSMADDDAKKCDEDNDPSNDADNSKLKRSCSKNKPLRKNIVDDESVENSKVGRGGKGGKRRGPIKTRYRNIYCTPEYREMRARKLTCEYCQKVCSSRRELLAHMNEHKDTGIHCPICHLVLVDPEERARHTQNHLETNPFVCATCLSTFAEESGVVSHQQREHKKTINIIMECMFCPFSSRSQERFTRHMTRCHMFGSEIPKHNPFDVSMMKKLLSEKQLNLATNINREASSAERDQPEAEGNGITEVSSADVKEHSRMVSQQGDGVDEQKDDLLDCSMLDMSGDLDESIDDIEEFLEKADQFHGFSSSQGELSELVVKIEKAEGSARMPSPSFDILSNTFQEEDEDDFTQQFTDPRAHSRSNDGCSDTSQRHHTNRTEEKSTDPSVSKDPVQSGPSEEHQQQGSSNSEYPPPSSEPQSNESGYSSHLTHSRISSIASSLSNKRVSISEVNVKKMKDHKLQVRNINRNSRLFKTFPSPDSTSGGK